MSPCICFASKDRFVGVERDHPRLTSGLWRVGRCSRRGGIMSQQRSTQTSYASIAPWSVGKNGEASRKGDPNNTMCGHGDPPNPRQKVSKMSSPGRSTPGRPQRSWRVVHLWQINRTGQRRCFNGLHQRRHEGGFHARGLRSKILTVDLTRGRSGKSPRPKKPIVEYIRGTGLGGSALRADETGVDPLGRTICGFVSRS